MSNQTNIKLMNNKKVCMQNSFCEHNLTDVCFKCSVYAGILKFNNLFKSVNSKSINKVLNRIYD